MPSLVGQDWFTFYWRSLRSMPNKLQFTHGLSCSLFQGCKAIRRNSSEENKNKCKYLFCLFAFVLV